MSKTTLGLCVAVAMLCTQQAHAELLALYQGDKINGPDANVVLDSSGNGNHGIFRGTGTIEADGVTGGALGFPDTGGTTIWVNPAANGAFDSISEEQGLTVGFWMAGEESAANPRNQSVFWAVGVEGETDRAFQAHVPWSNGQVYFDVGGCCNADTQRVNGPIDRAFWDAATEDVWTHYAFTIDPEFGDANVYINGEPVLTREPSIEGAFIPPLSELWIGSARNGGNRFSGKLDDFFIMDEALSEDAINDIIEDGAGDFFNVDEPDEYVPAVTVGGSLVNLDGKLGGSAYVAQGDGDVSAWSVEEVFRVDAGGTEVVGTVDLSGAGVSGDSAVGDANTTAALGDVPLTNEGADDITREFNLNVTVTGANEPIYGDTINATVSGMITLEGSGAGEIDPFILRGDLDMNGEVGFPDFLRLAANFGAKKGEGAASLPEPSGLALLSFAGLAMGGLRRRRR